MFALERKRDPSIRRLEGGQSSTIFLNCLFDYFREDTQSEFEHGELRPVFDAHSERRANESGQHEELSGEIRPAFHREPQEHTQGSAKVRILI